MHAIWSRAAQAQSFCRCRGCLHSATTITRRATTAASRRRVTAADIFTACYTTILGTAAVVDAHRKEARKNELDEKLDRARAALSSLAFRDAPNQNEASACESSSAPPSSAETPIGTSQFEAGIPSTSTASLLKELGDLAASTYRSTTHSWRQRQVDWAAVEAAISAEEQDSDIHLRHPHTEVQMARTTQTIETLVGQLLWQCRASMDQKPHSTQLDENQRQESILDEVEKLRTGPHYPSYENPFADAGGAAEARALLSDSFRRIFDKTADVNEVVGKICHNLLLSRTPPNIHNYNALIAGFNRIQRPDLAQSVVDSYMADTRWPATQQTMVCLLNHAVAANDIEQFRNVVRRMRGVAEDGLHFRIVSKSAIFNSHGLLWAEVHCASRKHAWVERAKRGNDVFNSLIQGWLHFGKVGTASMSFVACLREGRFVSVDTIQDLLSQALSSLDQQSARKLLKGLARNFENFADMMNIIYNSSPAQVARSIAEMFYSLFDLSGLQYAPIAGGVRKSIRILLRKLRSLHVVTQANIELDEIEEAFCETNKPFGTCKPYSKRVSDALAALIEKPHIGQTDATAALSKESHNSQIEDMAAKRISGIGALSALLQQCDLLEKRTLRIEGPCQGFRHICSHRSRLPPIDLQNREWLNQYPAVFHALRSIDLKRLSPKKLRRQLLLGLPDQRLAKQFEDFAWWKNVGYGVLMSLYQDGPNASVRVGAYEEEASATVARIGRQIENNEDATRVILFSYLKKQAQFEFREAYPNWYKMPLTELYEHHIRRLKELKTPSLDKHSIVEVEEDEAASMTKVAGSPEAALVLAPGIQQRPLAASGELVVHKPARLSLNDARPAPIMTCPERQVQSCQQSHFYEAAAMA
ncbi:hypothetical protein PG985_008654 [Apiospora marii]|uniref:uncharacterized protein n=1 Tax=Apiospora marii TaxID=335849 RepID=UPI00312EDAD5